MRCLSLAALAIALSGLAWPTLAAPPFTATTPVFGKIVAYTLPEGFKGAFEDANDSFYIQEAIPAGESVDNWSQMITMTGNKGQGASGAQPLEMAAENMRAGYQKACPETFTAQSFGPSLVDGREALTVFLGCGAVDAAQGRISEKAVIAFIRGDDNVYTIQWAEHTAAEAAPPSYDQAIWSARMAQLNPIKICDRVEGENAPYPSCNAK